MRRTLIVSAAIFFSSLPSVPAAAESVSRSRMDKLESGCRSGCLRDSGDFSYCKAYCQCVRREVFTGRSVEEVDALYGVMRPNAPDTPAKQLLTDLMNGCIQEADEN